MVDVDFVPMPNLYESLKRDLNGVFNSKLANKTNAALVIPAFSVNNSDAFPQTKQDIIRTWQKTLTIFRGDYALAKGLLFKIWAQTNDVIHLPFQLRTECYYVIEREYSPKYQDIFLQRWYDKIAHFYELYSIGFRFWIYPSGYIIHMPHKEVKGELIQSSKYCAQMYFRNDFQPHMRELQRYHNVTFK